MERVRGFIAYDYGYWLGMSNINKFNNYMDATDPGKEFEEGWYDGQADRQHTEVVVREKFLDELVVRLSEEKDDFASTNDQKLDIL